MINQLKNKLVLAAAVAPVYAADNITLNPEAGTGFDELTNLSVGGIISGAVSLVLIIVAVVFFFILVIGGLKWVTSGGDEKKVAGARSQITNALIGLAIVFSAWAIMKLLGSIFGFDFTGRGFNLPNFSGSTSSPSIAAGKPCDIVGDYSCNGDERLQCIYENTDRVWTGLGTCPDGCDGGYCK